MGVLRNEARRARNMQALTPQMAGALRWLASRGEMTVRRENQFIRDEISIRTAWALERRGYVERRWTGGEDGVVYITEEGRARANELDGICDECGEELEDDACTNPHCANWRFGADFDKVAPR